MNRDSNQIKTRVFYGSVVGASLLSVGIALLYREVIPPIPFIVLVAFIIGLRTKEKILFTAITLLESYMLGMALGDTSFAARCTLFFLIYMALGMLSGMLVNKAKSYKSGAWGLHQKKYPIRIFFCILFAILLLGLGCYTYYLYFKVF